MHVTFDELKKEIYRVLIKMGFHEKRADLCAEIFAGNSRDGVPSHGLNRFPVFVKYIELGYININAEPTVVGGFGAIEKWDGNLAPGMYTATLAMNRAIEMAKQHGVGCVAVKNTNHWMRGGTYGWQAADKGCIAFCGTNAISNMPPWGGKTPTLANNPFVIAVPRKEGNLVLDMAMSQFSYGKMQEYRLRGSSLPVYGGYDDKGELSRDPSAIVASRRTLPAGFWKGSGLSLMMDVLAAALSDGQTVKRITARGGEYGVSQFFICLAPQNIDESIINEIIDYAKSSVPVDERSSIRYPGEQPLLQRKKSEKEGVEVNEEIWEKVRNL
mgnify:CR=1 FL=1